MGKPDKPIPYGRHWVDDEDIRAVVSVLKSDWLTQGAKVAEFEEALAAYCGSKYAVAVANGTAGLHLACLALGIGKGSGLVTTPNTFVASANCALYSGHVPYFADIAGETLNIDPDRVEALLKKPGTGGKIKAIIPVHFAGRPCDMKVLSDLADKYGQRLIEDGCHALGAGTKKRGGGIERVGSCRHSDMTVFSFHQVKHITTGEGGAVLTNDKRLYEKLCTLRSHGITKDKGRMSRDPGPWYYEMVDLGYNYRLTDLQCALGHSQLKRLDSFVERRRAIAAQYDAAFEGMEHVVTPAPEKGVFHSYHLYVLKVDFKELKTNRRKVMEGLAERGVRTQVHYIPVHLQPYYKKTFGYKAGDFPAAESYYDSALSIPMYPKMTKAEVSRVIRAVRECLTR